MIIDTLSNCQKYYAVHDGLQAAFEFLMNNDLEALTIGKHSIEDGLFAIVQEYDTQDKESEQMESHRKYIDVQYVVSGAEQVGHALLAKQQVSKEYDSENDFMTYRDAPEFYTLFEAGTFMVFFPTDLHMPCLKVGESGRVKKIVVKVPITR